MNGTTAVISAVLGGFAGGSLLVLILRNIYSRVGNCISKTECERVQELMETKFEAVNKNLAKGDEKFKEILVNQTAHSKELAENTTNLALINQSLESISDKLKTL